MPYGVSVSDESRTLSQIKNNFIRKIKKIIARYGFDDEEWAQAISSQYFLLCIAKQLKWGKKDYANLLNKCLSCFSVTYTGDYILDSEKLLITPNETNKIVQCMQEEDNIDDYYTHSAKMQAKNINGEQMYLNFHFGLLIRIVSSEDTEVLRAIKHKCLDNLMADCALDTSDGWYPYRVPWITARILISLKKIDYSTYPAKDQVDEVIKTSITSLYQRIDDKAAFWRSGVGKWVSKWEATGLCLEALFVWDAIDNHKTEIRRILDYACSKENRDSWLGIPIDFTTEDGANNTLSATILASVIFRITKKSFSDIHMDLCDGILKFFDNVINVINKNAVNTVRQYCTIPQILHYVLAAFENID